MCSGLAMQGLDLPLILVPPRLPPVLFGSLAKSWPQCRPVLLPPHPDPSQVTGPVLASQKRELGQ